MGEAQTELRTALKALHRARCRERSNQVLWNSKGILTLNPMTEELGPGCWSLGSSDETGFSSLYLTAPCWEKVRTRIASHLDHPLPEGIHELLSDGECALMLRSWGRRTFTLALCNGGGWSTQFTVTPVIWRKTAERVESLLALA